MEEVDWIDLPDDDFVTILGYETPNTIELSKKVKIYNSLKKSARENLSSRIINLEEIISFVTNWVDHGLSEIDKKKHLSWIIDIATKKRNYLIALSELYSNNQYLHDAQSAYHTDVSSQSDPKRKVVILTNHRFFSLKMREYWGDFWFESLDPCHRRLTPFLEQWEKVTNPPHFFLWLEDQHIPKYTPRVNYLQNETLASTKLYIQNGLICSSDKKPIHFLDPKGRLLFSIGLDETIYAAEEGNGISHSSFTSGRPVLGAGLFFIDKGYLRGIALESGHYMPTTEIGFQIINILQEKNIAFPETLELIFFYDRNKYTAFLTQDDLQDFSSFEIALEKPYSSHISVQCTH